MWKCEKCKREFKLARQTHSCVIYPIEKHFINKKHAENLFDCLVDEINKKIGKVKIESLPCCIHLISDYSFGAVWALKDRIRIDFRLDHEIKTSIQHKTNHMSKNRYLFYFDILDKKDINSEIISLLKEAYHLNIINKEEK